AAGADHEHRREHQREAGAAAGGRVRGTEADADLGAEGGEHAVDHARFLADAAASAAPHHALADEAPAADRQLRAGGDEEVVAEDRLGLEADVGVADEADVDRRSAAAAAGDDVSADPQPLVA